MTRSSLAVILALIALPAIAKPQPAAETNKRVVLDFYVNGIRAGNAGVAYRYLAPDMVEHNSRVPAGPDGLRQFLARLPPAVLRPPNILRAIADDQYVILHVLNQRGPEDRGTQVIELFRLQDGKIVEHWDVMQPVPESMANGAAPY